LSSTKGILERTPEFTKLIKGMEHFPRKRKMSPYDSIYRTTYGVDEPHLDNT
jgi:hypothetical protein